MKDHSYVSQIDLFPPQLLDNGIKLVKKLDISPSNFKSTRMELVSNTYQFYRFSALTIKYITKLPNSINANFIAFIDPDPLSNLDGTVHSSEDVLRIATEHQGSVQKDVLKPWSVSLPIRRDDQLFYVGDNGDVRQRKMGTLYIYQVGNATRFDGSLLTEELSAGTLNVYYTIHFSSPQLQPIVRVFDIRSFNDATRPTLQVVNKLYATTTAYPGGQLPASKYRQANFALNNAIFPSIGTYLITMCAPPSTTSNYIRSVSYFAFPYSYGPIPYSFGGVSGTDLFTSITNASITLGQATQFLSINFGHLTRTIQQKPVPLGSDVIAQNNTYYDANATGEITYAINPNSQAFATDTNQPCVGQIVVYNDGVNWPLIQGIIEYKNPTQANTGANIVLNIQLAIYSYNNLPHTAVVDPVLFSIPPYKLNADED